MMKTSNNKTRNGVGNSTRKFTTQASLDSYVWSICDILRRSNCAGALQYVPELTWILFLRILDDREGQEAEQAEAVGAEFTPSLEAPYRWQDWAAPEGTKRLSLQMGPLGGFFGFVNGELLPYLKGLRDICDEFGLLLMFDEVQTGNGRTGKLYAYEVYGVAPDIMATAKGLGGGFPVGACLANAKAATGMVAGTHGSTFGGNPVCIAAALKTIELLEGWLIQNSAEVGAYLKAGLEKLQTKHDCIGDVRGMGLMQGVELVKDRKTREPHPQAVLKIFEETKKRGVLLGKGGLYGNVIRIGPLEIAA